MDKLKFNSLAKASALKTHHTPSPSKTLLNSLKSNNPDGHFMQPAYKGTIVSDKSVSGASTSRLHHQHRHNSTKTCKTVIKSNFTLQNALELPLSLDGQVAHTDNKSPQEKNRMLGIMFASTGGVALTFATIIAKYLNSIPVGLITFYRYVGLIILILPALVESHQPWYSSLWLTQLLLFIRGIFGCTAIWFRFASLAYISLVNCSIVMLAGIQIFVFLFGTLLLGERFGRFHAISLMCSLLGIFFSSNIIGAAVNEETVSNTTESYNFTTTTPALHSTESIFITDFSTLIWDDANSSSAMPSTEEANKRSSMHNLLVGNSLVIASSFFCSLAFIIVRMMAKVHYAVIMFNFSIAALVEMTIVNLIGEGFVTITAAYSIFLLVLLALSSFYGIMFTTLSLQMEEAGIVTVVQGSTMAVLAFIGDAVVFNQLPTVFPILGAFLAICAAIIISLHEYIDGLPEDHPTRKRFQFMI